VVAVIERKVNKDLQSHGMWFHKMYTEKCVESCVQSSLYLKLLNSSASNNMVLTSTAIVGVFRAIWQCVMCMPGTSTRPRYREDSQSCLPLLSSIDLFECSVQSLRITFFCLSKQMSVPTKVRPSTISTRMRSLR